MNGMSDIVLIKFEGQCPGTPLNVHCLNISKESPFKEEGDHKCTS